MASCTFAKKTDCKKISSKVSVRHVGGKIFALGNITGITKSCICIKTTFCLPLNLMFELLLPCQRTVLGLPVRVSGFAHLNTLHDTMSVDVVHPSQEYSDFVERCTS